MGYTLRASKRRGRPSFKYKHGRALTAAERVRALRAKRVLAMVPITSPEYKKALVQLKELYSEGVNPNKEKTELKNRYGNRVDIHGFNWEDTAEGREHVAWEEEIKRKERHSRLGAGRPSLKEKPMSSAERVFRHRLRKKLGLKIKTHS